MTFPEYKTLFDSNTQNDLHDWEVVTDQVMGGRSNGNFSLNVSGNAIFEGEISLENNGGFVSVQLPLENKAVNDYSHFKIKLKGDGKPYQFRTKSATTDRHSYIYKFKTSGAWQTLSIPMQDMQPQFRGEQLPMSNYPAEQLEQITFLFANKKKENFKLIIDKIWLELE